MSERLAVVAVGRSESNTFAPFVPTARATHTSADLHDNPSRAERSLRIVQARAQPSTAPYQDLPLSAHLITTTFRAAVRGELQQRADERVAPPSAQHFCSASLPHAAHEKTRVRERGVAEE